MKKLSLLATFLVLFLNVVDAGTPTLAQAKMPLGPVAVSSGANHTCALLSDKSVYCWGSNDNGQLGDGSNIDRSVPTKVIGLTNVKAIELGANYSCAIKEDLTAVCWGRNEQGQLGDGSFENKNLPATVSGISNASSISAGATSTCVLLLTKKVKCWGDNTYWQLGDDSIQKSSTPIEVSNLDDVSKVSVGYLHACALSATGSVKCWGDNSYWQLGTETVEKSATPLEVIPEGETFLAAGGFHNCVHRGCWGRNSEQQISQSTHWRLLPFNRSFMDNRPWTGYLSSLYFTCSMGPDFEEPDLGNKLYCGGYDWSRKRLDNWCDGCSTQPNRVLTFSLGMSHACVILEDHTMKCWGDNSFGQLGNGLKENKFYTLPTFGRSWNKPVGSATIAASGKVIKVSIKGIVGSVFKVNIKGPKSSILKTVKLKSASQEFQYPISKSIIGLGNQKVIITYTTGPVLVEKTLRIK